MTLIQKYIWVIETLHRYGPLSLKDLNEKWLAADAANGVIVRQTFDRWKSGIVDMFGVIIDCQLDNGYRYYIENPEVLDKESTTRWILESFTAIHAVAGYTKLQGRILVENIPSCAHFLKDVLEAMQQNHVLRITYHSFHRKKSSTFLVEPYCVRLFQKRWYLLAHSIYDDLMRLYALDRVVDLQFMNKSFVLPAEFDGEAWFNSFFGVVLDRKVKDETVILRVKKDHRDYMRTLPIHSSQKEIRITDDYSDFQLNLRPTYDFCMELLRVGAMVEVLSPQSLRHQMNTWVRGLWNLYKND